MTDPLHWREWLVRQLRDDRLSDKEVASILAWHPAITDEWRTPELKALMEAKKTYDSDRAGIMGMIHREALGEAFDAYTRSIASTPKPGEERK